MTTEPTTNRHSAIVTLDEQLVNQIAAGEVIDRPASVVKELVENALDAAASRVVIAIDGAGSSLIAVHDDGTGMTAEDIPHALERHATSKIRRLDDLNEIRTFGFRGEALPSIASVSHLEIVSRARGQEEGTRFRLEGGRVVAQESVGCDVGTSVLVRNLFFNTPARRKFLKTPSTELKHIIATVTDFAIAHPRVAFELSIDNKPNLTLPISGSPRDRLAGILGRDLAEEMIAFERANGDLAVRGFLAKPEHARQSRDRMALYVNGRKVFSASLQHAILRGYGELIPRGKFPIAICFLTINPHRIDVNVHPTKREVRFNNERAVFELLHYSINQAVFGARSAPAISIIDSTAGQSGNNTERPISFPHGLPRDSMSRPVTGRQQEAIRQLHEPLPFQTGHRPDDEIPQAGVMGSSAVGTPNSTAPPREASQVDSSPLPPLPEGEELSRVWQVNTVYIVLALGDELLVLDQHTAHERILFEQILDRLQDGRPESQRLLFAESIELEHFDFGTFQTNVELLRKMGFEAREFGDRTVLLEAAPTGLKSANPVILFRRVLEDITMAQRAGEDVSRAAAASYACRAAVMSGDVLKPAEMVALYRQLRRARNPLVCPHGRPTFVRIPLAEFDRKFCRA